MLRDWLPFLIYGLLALAIPSSMIVMSFAFAQRPQRRTKARVIPFESGVSQGRMKPQETSCDLQNLRPRPTVKCDCTATQRTSPVISGSSFTAWQQ